jgi:hypothetical protein
LAAAVGVGYKEGRRCWDVAFQVVEVRHPIEAQQMGKEEVHLELMGAVAAAVLEHFVTGLIIYSDH